jgi:hypothetical protein
LPARIARDCSERDLLGGRRRYGHAGRFGGGRHSAGSGSRRNGHSGGRRGRRETARIGGIQDQIQHGVTGVLLEDSTDIDTFGRLVLDLLNDPQRAQEIGARAREHVRRNFLANRHAVQYIDLFASVIEAREHAAAAP